MKTKLTQYHIDTNTDEGFDEYEALKAKLRATPGRGHRMHVIGDRSNQRHKIPEGEIELDTGHLFNNQWNTVDTEEGNGWRVFDWYQAIWPNSFIKSGHYLDITPEMAAARQSRYSCGYCGHQVDEPELVFCDKCRGSEYLEEKDLPLLRLRPVAEDKPRNNRPPLTPEEEAALLPTFKEAKKAQRLAAFEKNKERAKAQAAKKVEHAKTEEAAILWLIDHDIDPGLVIFYSHTERFCFGWRHPLDPEQKAELLEKLGSEFPYDYDIKQTEAARLA